MARNDDWHRAPAIYEIHPRSFKDTSGSGMGDLPGVLDRLDYVARLGVDAVWIGPFYVSPMVDGGYDIADHRAVDPRFGTLEDFDAIVEKTHDLGMRLIVDCVFNHTSDEHPWFKAALNGDEEKADCYVFRDPKTDGTPPNNWLSQFGPPAWTWAHTRQQYYHHHFLDCQPSLNLRNPLVHQMYRETIQFWRDRGVDGFRLDVVTAYLFDEEMRDNPPARPVVLSKVTGPIFNPYSYQDHVHDVLPGGGAEWTENIREWAGEDVFLLGESNTGNQSIEQALRFTEKDRLNACYTIDTINSGDDPMALRSLLLSMRGKFRAPVLFSSHDHRRHVSSLGDGTSHQAKFFALLLAAMPGPIILYQGEELGLPHPELSKDETVDPFDLLYWPTPIGRDGARVPIPWTSDGPTYGFTEGEPWLPMRWHGDLAVDQQECDHHSVLTFYRHALAWRRESGVGKPERFDVDGSDTILSFRSKVGDTTWLSVFNFSSDKALPVPTYQHETPRIATGWNGRMLAPRGAAVWVAHGEDMAETACG